MHSQNTNPKHGHDAGLLSLLQVEFVNLRRWEHQHPNIYRNIQSGVCECHAR